MSSAVAEDQARVMTEFAEAELGDIRRTQRLVEIATMLAQQPGASLPETCGSQAMLKAAYRFFDNEAIEPAEIVASHLQATISRLACVPVVLAAQDTTELNWTAHPATTGLGPLAHPRQRGLLAHSTLALTPEGVPLGVLAQQVWARDPDTVSQRATRKSRPVAAKESHKWIQRLEAVIEVHEYCPQTHFVSVGDREADVYDLFLVPRPVGVDLLVRAAWDRRVEHPEQYLWARLAAHPMAGTLTLEVPRRGSQPARTATLTVRFGRVRLRPPRYRQAEHWPTVEVFAVQGLEEHPPADLAPIEWLLLSTRAVTSFAEAVERVQGYTARWGIEVLHKVLKSGCRIESRQLETAECLQRCLPVYSVIAWRILYATLAQPYRARPALYRAVGTGGMAGPVLCHPLHPNPASYAPNPAAGSALDCPPRGLPGAPGRWRTRRHRIVAGLSASYRSHPYVPHYAPCFPETKKCG